MIYYIWVIIGIAAIYISMPVGYYLRLLKVIRYYITWSKNDGPFLIKRLRSELSILKQRLAALELLIYGSVRLEPEIRDVRVTGTEAPEVEMEVRNDR